MPSTPKIVTRSATTSSNSSDNLNKGSKLTFAEMDSNFIELKNGAIGVVADDSSTLDVKAGDTLYIQGGSNVTTSTDSAGVLTINSTGGDSLGDLTAVGSTISSPSNADISLQPGGTGAVDMGAIRIRDNHIENTRSNDDIIVDPNGTGNIILNPAASTYGQVVIKGGGSSGGTIYPQLKIIDETGTELLLGNSWSHASRGSTIASGSGEPLHIQGGNGQQAINMYGSVNIANGGLNLGTGSGSSGQYTSGIISTPTNTADNKGSDLELRPGASATTAGDIVALGLRITGGHTGTTITADATNAAITLQGNGTGGVNLDGVMVQDNTISTETSNSNIELRPNGTGSVVIDDAALIGTPKVGDGTGNATLTSNGAHNLVLNTNSGTNSGSIEIVDGATGQIAIHTNGHGNISIGSNSGTGDGTATTTVEGTRFKRFANSTSGEWLNIPMSADGSTSQDVVFQMNSGKPELYFNSAGSAASDSAKIRVGTGGLTIQTDGANSSDANIRIQSAGGITLDAAGTIKLGGDTIVVSGNKMFTDSSNEDFELEANGSGNISMLSPANMNSNKIINVTDPTSAQDAATKAYVDANQGTGDLSFIGSTISSPSNADLTLTTSGTGVVAIDNLTVDSNINITDNEIKATVSNSDLMLSSSGTGRVVTRDILEIQNNTSGPLTGADKIVFSGSSGTGDKTIECDPLGVGNLSLHLKSSQNGQVKIGHAAEVQIPATGHGTAGSIELKTDQTSGGRADCVIVFNTGDSAGTYSQTVVAPNPEDLTANSQIRIPGGSTSQSFVGTEATQTMTNKTLTSPVLNTGVSGTAIKDEDNMSSNSATHLATQQSIKAYVDAEVAGAGSASTGDITFVGSTMISPSNADITLNPAGTGKVNINAVYTLPNADGSANQVLGTNGSGVLSFRDPTAINIDGGVADSTYTSVPTIDGGTA